VIERIFIPTVNRADNQITYDNLPDALKQRVTMVVQAWERDKYQYPCDYLVLPEEINLDDYYCLPKTRKIIYEAGQNMKYAVLDDDLTFGRRNAKYWTDASNMEMSKRKATEADVLEMFDLYSKWLDEPTVTVCGCGHAENPPQGNEYSNNASLSSAFWINGNDFKDLLPELELTRTKVAEDTVFLLSLLSRGYGNRVSQEFIFFNNSVHTKNMKSTIWDEQTFEATHRDHKIVESMFPGIFTVLYNHHSGERVKGGFRDYGKTRTDWSKAFGSHQRGSLEDLF
jgi:hypothetical protein